MPLILPETEMAWGFDLTTAFDPQQPPADGSIYVRKIEFLK